MNIYFKSYLLGLKIIVLGRKKGEYVIYILDV